MKSNDEKYIIIVGCGRLGAHLASTLADSKKNSVVIIDSKEEAFERLDISFSGFKITADATEVDTLLKAKIEDADVFVATTNHDNINIMVAQIAKKLYGIKKVIARLTEPERAKIYDELGIDTISPMDLSADEFRKIIINSGESL